MEDGRVPRGGWCRRSVRRSCSLALRVVVTDHPDDALAVDGEKPEELDECSSCVIRGTV